MLSLTLENRSEEANPKRGGTEGGRFTDSTEDSGPEKPGNRAEDKTLTIREMRTVANIRKENPPFMTVNTQLILIFETFADRPE